MVAGIIVFIICLYHRGHLCYHGRYVVITAVIIILTALFAVVFVIVIIMVIAFIVMIVVNDIIMDNVFIVVGVVVNVTAVDDMVIAIVMSPVRLFDRRSFGLAWRGGSWLGCRECGPWECYTVEVLRHPGHPTSISSCSC